MGGAGATSFGIFISYRRADSAYPAGWLYERLAERFGRDRVFKDVDALEPGDDFVSVITEAVTSCAVLIAVIGEKWLTCTGEDAQRRLDDPGDFVRLEIEIALSRDIRVIPVLVNGARMPREIDLPASLQPLTRRHALELSPNRFNADTLKLITVLEKTPGVVAALVPQVVPTAPALLDDSERQTDTEARTVAANSASASPVGPPDAERLTRSLKAHKRIIANPHGGSHRGADMETEITLSFGEAVQGTAVQLLMDGPGDVESILLKVPPGIGDQQRIRLKGRGMPGTEGEPSGDLYVLVHVTPHPVFGRSGPNLTVTVPVTLAELEMGAEIRVPTHRGSPITMRIPRGTRNRKTFRIPGHGISIQGQPTGSMLVTVEVMVPEPPRVAVYSAGVKLDNMTRTSTAQSE